MDAWTSILFQKSHLIVIMKMVMKNSDVAETKAMMLTHIVKLKFHLPVISTVACEVALKYFITT